MADLLKNEQLAGVDPNVIIKIISDLLPVVISYGLPLIEKVIIAIKEDPNLPAEAIRETIQKRLEEASKINKEILDESN